MTKKRTGRPKIKLDYELIEKLSHIQCTQSEIAGVLGVSIRTLLRDKEFNRIYKKAMQTGKVSLRRFQWKSADKGSVPMLIHLGKQYLGQREGTGEEQLPIPSVYVVIDTDSQTIKIKKTDKEAKAILNQRRLKKD